MSTPVINAIVPDETHASLQLVSGEIAAELNEARAALEVFAEHPEDRGALHRFAAHVHLARGALRLAEVYGGALLAEEMEHEARHVDTHSAPGKADTDGLDALLRLSHGAVAGLPRSRRLGRPRRAARAAPAPERPALTIE